MIVDRNGDYAIAYIIIGIGIISSGLILSIILCHNQYAKKNKRLNEANKNTVEEV